MAKTMHDVVEIVDKQEIAVRDNYYHHAHSAVTNKPCYFCSRPLDPLTIIR